MVYLSHGYVLVETHGVSKAGTMLRGMQARTPSAARE